MTWAGLRHARAAWADRTPGCPILPPSPAQTVDEYYVSEVQWILDTAVVDSLLANPARKMTYVEISYFQRWWNEQSVRSGSTPSHHFNFH